jgi:hypothetical protein
MLSKRAVLALLTGAVAGPAAAGTRPHVSFAFVHSTFAPPPLLPRGRSTAVTMSAASGMDAAEMLGSVIATPLRFLIRIVYTVGGLLPDSLPHWWSVRVQRGRGVRLRSLPSLNPLMRAHPSDRRLRPGA